MKIHYVQHVAFEDPAQILTWALSNGHALAATRLHLNERLPDPDEFDLLIIMGGPMSVHDHDRYSWLKDEKKFIESAIATGKKVLGICLGAQLIAHVLGAPVKKNRTPEIGWYEVFRTEDSGNSIFEALPP
jgi:GMP synthase-like glutamine amidotransferase